MQINRKSTANQPQINRPTINQMRIKHSDKYQLKLVVGKL